MKLNIGSKDLIKLVKDALPFMWMAVSPLASAQDFVIDASVLASGAATLIEKDFELAGTAGQPFTGIAIGENGIVLEAGFWPVKVGLAAARPQLQAEHTGGLVIISWDPNLTGYLLEETANLAAPVNWTEVPGVTQNQVAITPTEQAKIYRLKSI